MNDKLPGHIETPLDRAAGVRVVLTSMAPEARDCLDEAMERWRAWKAQMSRQPTDEVYAFAYWLLRYSGLVVPARSAPEHLREDAMHYTCTVCQRQSWDRDSFNQLCGMPQPGGVRCPGFFR